MINSPLSSLPGLDPFVRVYPALPCRALGSTVPSGLVWCVMQMDACRLELFLPEWLRWTAWCKGLMNSEKGRSQDSVLRTASWAKFSRPSGAIAKQLIDGHRIDNRGYLPRTPLAKKLIWTSACFRGPGGWGKSSHRERRSYPQRLKPSIITRTYGRPEGRPLQELETGRT
jgi:hypothetical protein